MASGAEEVIVVAAVVQLTLQGKSRSSGHGRSNSKIVGVDNRSNGASSSNNSSSRNRGSSK